HTIHTIWDEMIYIQKWYPTAGALDAKSILFHEHDIDVPKLLFRYLFIPWVQAELNRYIERTNYTIRRADKYKILPTGIPLNIFDSPHRYGTLNFKVMMPPGVIAEARQLYANPEHGVFQLVPPDFMHYTTGIYNTLGSPAIIRKNIWDIYQQMCLCFLAIDALPCHIVNWRTHVGL
ncbi:hypothetical protein AN958_03791, partial [Leucoagaricus sp. SymC.cos]